MMNDQFPGGAVELSKPAPPSEECPINTKFCYYNNYKKSQPRHFCNSCKRHWTKGGTLRPKKRPRTSKMEAHDFESNILILSSTCSIPQFTILESNGTTTHTQGSNARNHPNAEFTFSSFTSLISNPASDYCQTSSDYDVDSINHDSTEECRPAVDANDLWSWNDQIDLLGINTVWGSLTFP